MTEQIETLIDQRDECWQRVQLNASPTAEGITEVEALNYVLERLLNLAPGPSTPVLSPLRTRVELLRVDLCRILCEHARAEIRGQHRPGNVHLAPVIEAPELVQSLS